MTGARSPRLTLAGRLAAIGGGLGVAAGLVQATIGSRMPDWSGNKDQPVALGLLTIVLGASVLVAARTLHAATRPGDRTLAAIALWLAAVAVVCSTTVGRFWAIPGALLVVAAGVTVADCGWHRFRSVVATDWLRGLLGFLGALELLMAVSAGPTSTVAAGVLAGAALIAVAIIARPARRAAAGMLVAATLPFAALTWWTIVTPLLTVVALAIGLAATGRGATSTGAGTRIAPPTADQLT